MTRAGNPDPNPNLNPHLNPHPNLNPLPHPNDDSSRASGRAGAGRGDAANPYRAFANDRAGNLVYLKSFVTAEEVTLTPTLTLTQP